MRTESLFLGPVDRTHPAPADEGLDQVAGELASDHRVRALAHAHPASVCERRGICNVPKKCHERDTRSVVCANDTESRSSYSRFMTDRTREEHTIKRIAIILGIAAAMGVAPSVAAAGNVTAQVKPQVTAQIVKQQVTAQVVNAQAVKAQVVAQRANAKRVALLIRVQSR